ncbi:unnamed protein product [Symbiodinium pilosum]|uniref:Uncharacterized protein n=1 Tax=Symbiodinium pilosum TaxID=2952 RepID=A0A812LLU0_SYMPI|nr:unnamed protein product [Symbiodinium pilosum]
MVWSVPCCALTILIHVFWREDMINFFKDSSGLDSIWSGYTFILGFLIVFRSNQAYSRFWESVSLTHKIRGEWTSAFSSLLGFCTKSEDREADVNHFREYLLRLMSLLHCYALHEVAELSDENIEVVDLAGMSSESVEYLHGCPDRCETVMLWIERLIVEGEKQKLFDVAPPVLSRAFQELSNGMVNVAELRKIVEVPFPFPYSQYLSFMLVLHWLVSPLVAVQLISEWSWAGGTVWLISTSYWTLFYIAQEIDQPFGQDYNDLPVVEIQKKFNQSLMHLASPETYKLPDFIADLAHRRTMCMRVSRSTLRTTVSTRKFSSPAPSTLEVVVENDEVSSTHLAEVCDEPAADVVLVSPQSNKTILGPRAVDAAARRGIRVDEPVDLQTHKGILQELASPEWNVEDLDSFVDLAAAHRYLSCRQGEQVSLSFQVHALNSHAYDLAGRHIVGWTGKALQKLETCTVIAALVGCTHQYCTLTNIGVQPTAAQSAKTRLAASIGDDAACRLATAFISDFIFMASNIDWAYPVLATTEDGMDPSSFPPAAFPSEAQIAAVPRWRQPDGDLGAKIEGIVRQGLEQADATICLGADSPGRPLQRLEETRKALLDGHDAVLGPSEDGGYDLLALKSCPPGLLADLPWSQPTTFEATKKRLEENGLRVAVPRLTKWWDVDEVEDLKRLQELLDSEDGRQRAPATAKVMAEVGCSG